MTRTIAKLGDWMLSRLVPCVQASAACPETGYTYVRDCGCRPTGPGYPPTMYGQRCTVRPDCSAACGSCYPYDYC